MNESVASYTAMVTALMRSAHTRLSSSPLINDPWGEDLVPESFRSTLREIAAARMSATERSDTQASPDSIVDHFLLANPAYANVITRSRYAEDSLRSAIERGVRQYVLIGAGFDSFAVRYPPFARDVSVYEVDHPATQNIKRQRISECGLELPASVHFAPADLSKESLGEALSKTPYMANQPTFFAWLGVTMYLTRKANIQALHSISKCAAPGSELVFTYIDQRFLDREKTQSDTSLNALKDAVASIGEPFLSGFYPDTIEADLLSAGMALIEDLDGRQIAQRYGEFGSAASAASAGASRIARACVLPVEPSAAALQRA